MKKIDFDDRDLGIIAICIIAVIVAFSDPELAKIVLPAAVTAIARMATGKKGGGEA